MALTRFTQEPGYPDGAGLFEADDGSTFFAHDPEMAAQLSPDFQAAMAPPEDQMLASRADRADIDAITRDLAGGQQPPAPPPTASDVQPSRTVPAAAAPPPPSADMPQQPAQTPQSPSLAQAEALQQNVDAYAMRPVVTGPTRGRVVPTKQSETREAQGMPYDPNGPEALQRADASINMNLAGIHKADVESARAAGEAAAYKAALSQLEEQARIAQMRRDMQERQYRRDREDLEAAMEQSNKSAKSFNANRWFDDRGAIGQIGAAIAQAFGAGAAALTGGPNVVLNQINSYIDRDIANQRAQIEADEKHANNALAQLNRQFGNLDQAEAALKIAQQKKVETMAASYAASTKSEDVQNSLQMWLAENEQRRVAAEQQFQNAAYGKTQLTTEAKVIPSSRGGARPPTEKEIAERYGTLEKRNQVVGGTYENEIKRQKSLGMDPDKKDKTNELVVQNIDGSTTLARKPEEAEKIRNAYKLRSSSVRNLEQIKKIAQESASGGRVGEAKGRIRVLMKRALENVNTMSGQGIFRTDDDNYYTDALFGPGGGVRTEVIDELIGTANNEYQSHVDSQLGSAVKVQETPGGQRVQFTGQPSKTPTAAGIFKKKEFAK